MRLSRTRHPNRLIAAAAVVLGLAAAATAHAAGSGMPWEEPLQQVLESVQGPVAKIVEVIRMIVNALNVAFRGSAGCFVPLTPQLHGLTVLYAASSCFLRLLN